MSAHLTRHPGVLAVPRAPISGTRSGTVLVTGGAGYIGAHVAQLLVARGRAVVVVDDLSSGRLDRVPPGACFVRADLAGPGAVTKLAGVMGTHGVDSVIHLAGRKQVAESMARPAWYYRQNLEGLLNLHDAMSSVGVRRLVFSSSAAVYGDLATGATERIREDAPTSPISPYGQTKLAGEWLNRAAATAWGLRSVNLRYFNVAGAAHHRLADAGSQNLIPLVLRRVERGESPYIFGDDYPTADGTCVRDFIDVRDLAAAHLDALGYLDGPMTHGDVFNVGTGRGVSVAEVIQTALRLTGAGVDPVILARRPGDPAVVVADTARISVALGWRPEHDLDAMIASACQPWQAADARDDRQPVHG